MIMMENLPSAHDIAVSTENLCQTAHHNVRVGQHVDVDEVAHTLVDHYAKVVFVCQVSYAFEIWGRQKWIRRELCEQRHDSLAAF